MDEAELAELAVRDLEPLLAAKATTNPSQIRRRKKGGRSQPGNRFWVSVPGPCRLEVSMQRSLPLTVWEAAILEPYGTALADLSGIPDAIARHAADDVIVRAIARQLGNAAAGTVESAIRFLMRCAASTYESQPVHLNILLDLALNRSPVIASFDQFKSHDWYAVIGSGIDTGIVVNSTGGVVRVIDVRGLGKGADVNQLRPDAIRDLAGWTKTGRPRIALSLLRNGEIVIQQDRVLRYIFRSGQWRALPVDVALRSSWSAGSGVGQFLKQAVLASAIDASLGHHGASISIVTKGQLRNFEKSQVVDVGDLWPQNIRSRLFPAQKFQDLPRRQRLELLSMDGATVINHQGRILAAGAIVAVPGGSTGGGRLAATKALAKYGAALKVSQDGPIALFGLDKGGTVVEKMALA